MLHFSHGQRWFLNDKYPKAQKTKTATYSETLVLGSMRVSKPSTSTTGLSLSLYHSLFTGRAVLLDGRGRPAYQHHPCRLAQQRTHPLRHGVREKPDPSFSHSTNNLPTKMGGNPIFFITDLLHVLSALTFDPNSPPCIPPVPTNFLRKCSHCSALMDLEPAI